jgi:hypothetical protein
MIPVVLEANLEVMVKRCILIPLALELRGVPY